MLPWRVLLGAVLGAVLVKESRKANRMYDAVRAKAMAMLDKLRPESKPGKLPADDGPGSSSAPASN